MKKKLELESKSPHTSSVVAQEEASYMGHLSVEMFVEVMRNLNAKDLNKLALVSRLYSSCASAHLMRYHYIHTTFFKVESDKNYITNLSPECLLESAKSQAAPPTMNASILIHPSDHYSKFGKVYTIYSTCYGDPDFLSYDELPTQQQLCWYLATTLMWVRYDGRTRFYAGDDVNFELPMALKMEYFLNKPSKHSSKVQSLKDAAGNEASASI